MKASKDHVISIHYTLKDGSGNTLDSSQGQEPLSYIQGMNHIIPGLEDAINGRAIGDKFEVVVKSEDAYGPRNDQMVQTVPRAQFQDAEQMEVGMQFEMNTEQGPIVLTVVELQDESVVVDGNHPLAGVDLHFAVEISHIRAATPEEIDHGHVH